MARFFCAVILSFTLLRADTALQVALASARANQPKAEKLLKGVIRNQPGSDDAYEAYEQLAHIYLRTGRYQSLIADMEARWAAFPTKPETPNERSVMEPFRGLPDQQTVHRGASTFQHQNDIFLPVSVNGKQGSYFFDTGAGVSCLSEAEAKRLGLEIRTTAGRMRTATGGNTGFRTAIAHELRIGKIVFRDVSFAIFADDTEPWKSLDLGRRGILGRPILLAMQTVDWKTSGVVTVGGKTTGGVPFYFDQDAPVLTADYAGKQFKATMDTGAQTSDLYLGFSEMFPDAVARLGKKERMDVMGVGNTATFDSYLIDELPFRLAGADVTLRPAHVLQKQIGSKCCIANFGMDLFRQHGGFAIDFRRMTFRIN